MKDVQFVIFLIAMIAAIGLMAVSNAEAEGPDNVPEALVFE